MRRIGPVVATVLAAALVAASVTVAVALTFSTPSEAELAPTRARPAQVVYEPGPSATEINPTAPISVRVAGGILTQAALRSADGTDVAGTLSSDRSRWSTTEPLGYGQTYTWSGTATGADGAAVALRGGFSTLQPARQLRGVLNIGDGRTVGVAAPVEIQFNGHVENRAAVERALSVQTSTPVQGAWGWVPGENGGSRVHYRTKEYWPANTEVTVEAKFYGVDYGGGAYGRADVSTTFTVGRAQIVKADARSHRLVVMRDGEQVANYPASYGLASDPDRNTRSGIHVVTEKFTDKRMVSERYGYDTVEKWAVRMSNNGEFIHANPTPPASRGRATSPMAA